MPSRSIPPPSASRPPPLPPEPLIPRRPLGIADRPLDLIPPLSPQRLQDQRTNVELHHVHHLRKKETASSRHRKPFASTLLDRLFRRAVPSVALILLLGNDGLESLGKAEDRQGQLVPREVLAREAAHGLDDRRKCLWVGRKQQRLPALVSKCQKALFGGPGRSRTYYLALIRGTLWPSELQAQKKCRLADFPVQRLDRWTGRADRPRIGFRAGRRPTGCFSSDKR